MVEEEYGSRLACVRLRCWNFILTEFLLWELGYLVLDHVVIDANGLITWEIVGSYVIDVNGLVWLMSLVDVK